MKGDEIMVSHNLTCPACAAQLESAKLLPAGRRMRCPECGACFPALRSENCQPAPKPAAGPGKMRVRNWSRVVWGAAALLVAINIALALTIGRRAPEPAEKVAKLDDDPPRQGGDISGQPKSARAKTGETGQRNSAQVKAKTGTAKGSGSEAQALAPVKATLTQDWLNQWTAYTEWLLEIRLTESQRQKCQYLWVQRWKETDQTMKDRFWAHANAELKWMNEVAKPGAAESNDLRAQKRLSLLAGFRKSSDPDERLLLELYESAHRPGGERNPILVAGAPPLTKDAVDMWRRVMEWMLDVQLSEPERQEFQRLFTQDWKKWDHAARDRFLKKDIAGLASQLPRLDNCERNVRRAHSQPKVLAHLQKTAGADLSAWLLKIYLSAHRPGGERNPVLVPGEPPLTQAMLSAYGDYLEWILDLKRSGGLTKLQRRTLAEKFMSDWKEMDKSDRKEFFTLLKNWSAIAQSSAAERSKYREQLQPQLLAELRSAADHEPSQWLLAIYNGEQELAKSSNRKSRDER